MLIKWLSDECVQVPPQGQAKDVKLYNLNNCFKSYLCIQSNLKTILYQVPKSPDLARILDVTLINRFIRFILHRSSTGFFTVHKDIAQY